MQVHVNDRLSLASPASFLAARRGRKNDKYPNDLFREPYGRSFAGAEARRHEAHMPSSERFMSQGVLITMASKLSPSSPVNGLVNDGFEPDGTGQL